MLKRTTKNPCAQTMTDRKQWQDLHFQKTIYIHPERYRLDPRLCMYTKLRVGLYLQKQQMWNIPHVRTIRSASLIHVQNVRLNSSNQNQSSSEMAVYFDVCRMETYKSMLYQWVMYQNVPTHSSATNTRIIFIISKNIVKECKQFRVSTRGNS